MKKKTKLDADTMRTEYDFSNGVRGVTAVCYARGAKIAVADPAVPSKQREAVKR